MYIMVITRRKWLNTILLSLLATLLLIVVFQLVSLIIPETEITVDQRVSILFPNSTMMSSIYMTSPNTPAVHAGSLIGRKWKTETIRQLDMSEITFQYPETLRMDEIRNLGQEISVHINFQHSNNKVYGFFQIWKLNQPLNEFLNTSKKYSSMSFTHFDESAIKVHGLNGFMWDYVFINKTQDIKGMEAFIENQNEMYRFAMFVVKSDYKPQYKKIFMRMVESLKVKGTGAVSGLSYVEQTGQ